MPRPRHAPPPGRRLLVVLTAVAVLATVAAGIVLGRTGGDDTGRRLLPPPAAPIPIVTTVAPAVPSPSRAAPQAPPPARATGRPAPTGRRSAPARRAPRLVGPRDEDGFERLLSSYCARRGQRTAVLLPDRGDRAAGEWACVRAVTFTRIDLDEVCRAGFGGDTRARRLRPGDARSWRCFDR